MTARKKKKNEFVEEVNRRLNINTVALDKLVSCLDEDNPEEKEQKTKGSEFLKNLDLGVKSKPKKKVQKKKSVVQKKTSSKKLPKQELRFTKSLSLFQSDLDLLEKIDLDLRNRGIQLNTSQIIRLGLLQFQFDDLRTEDLCDDILEHYCRHKKQSSIVRSKKKK